MRSKNFTTVFATIACALLISFTSCKNDNDPKPSLSPSEILASAKWKTVAVKDSLGNNITAENMHYVGYGISKMDGTFTNVSFDGQVKGSGVWAITADGKKHIVITTNPPGLVRVDDIVTLTTSSFIYKTTNPQGQTVTVEHVPG